jgi:hypothetical protein
MSDGQRPTPEQQAALDAYWSAATPAEESAAYARMMALGLPDGYAPQSITMPAEVAEGAADVLRKLQAENRRLREQLSLLLRAHGHRKAADMLLERRDG